MSCSAAKRPTASLSIIDNTVPANWPGPFLHKHDFDEAFYVLEGELTFQVEDAVITKRAGELAFAPRGVAHTLANHSDAPGALRARVHAGRLRALLRADERRTRRSGHSSRSGSRSSRSARRSGRS